MFKKKKKQLIDNDEIVIKLNKEEAEVSIHEDMYDEVKVPKKSIIAPVKEKAKDIKFNDFDPTLSVTEAKVFDKKETGLNMSDLDEVEENEVFETLDIIDPPKAETVIDDSVVSEIEAEEAITGKSLNEEKKDLNVFFEEGKKKSKKLNKKEKKAKKKSKRSKKKERDLQDVKDRKIFRYRGKKYTKVEDFVKFLLDHYLDLDEIATEILDDENFYGWISKRSGIFEQSLKDFKEIKEKIEKI